LREKVLLSAAGDSWHSWLVADLGVGGFEGVLGVERAFLPWAGGFVGTVPGRRVCCVCGGFGEELFGLLVLVEEGAGDLGPAGDHRSFDRHVVAVHLAEGVMDAFEHQLGGVLAGLDGGLGSGRSGAHWAGSWARAASSLARKLRLQIRWK
jgi:hypothetical protein